MERLRAIAERMGPALAGFAALVLVLLLQWLDPAPLHRLQLQVFDAYQRAAPWDGPREARVAVVDIDEDLIKRLGQWPWPRTDLATLTRRLGQAKADVVAYDIVFSEGDRTSPEALADRYAGEDIGAQLAALPSHDVLLAESFDAVPVVLAYFLNREAIGRAVEPRMGISVNGDPPLRHVAAYRGALQPLPTLERAAAGTGFVSLEADDDGIIRRVPLVAYHRGTLVPSLALEAARVAMKAGSPGLLTSAGSGQGTMVDAAAVSMRIDDMLIPVDHTGAMWVHYPPSGAGSGADEVLSAASIITGETSDVELREKVAGRIVFVGGSAVGLQDLVSTPLSSRTGGVNVHAAATEQMLAGHFLERPDWAFGLETMLVLLLGLMLSLLLPRLGAALGALAALIAVGGIVALSWLAFANARYLLDPTWPVLAIASVYAVQTVAVYLPRGAPAELYPRRLRPLPLARTGETDRR